jgi:hypothetical protein
LKDAALEALKLKLNAVGVAVNAFPTTVRDELLGVRLNEQKEHPPDSVMSQLRISPADNAVAVLPSVVMVPVMPGVGNKKESRVYTISARTGDAPSRNTHAMRPSSLDFIVMLPIGRRIDSEQLGAKKPSFGDRR